MKLIIAIIFISICLFFINKNNNSAMNDCVKNNSKETCEYYIYK